MLCHDFLTNSFLIRSNSTLLRAWFSRPVFAFRILVRYSSSFWLLRTTCHCADRNFYMGISAERTARRRHVEHFITSWMTSTLGTCFVLSQSRSLGFNRNSTRQRLPGDLKRYSSGSWCIAGIIIVSVRLHCIAKIFSLVIRIFHSYIHVLTMLLKFDSLRSDFRHLPVDCWVSTAHSPSLPISSIKSDKPNCA